MDAAAVLERVTGDAGESGVRSVLTAAAAGPYLSSFPTRSHLSKHELPASVGRQWAELAALVAFDAAADCALFALLWSMFCQWSRHCTAVKAAANRERKSASKQLPPLAVLASVYQGMVARKRPRMSAADEAYCAAVGFRLFDSAGPSVGQLALAAECHDTRTLLAHFPGSK